MDMGDSTGKSHQTGLILWGEDTQTYLRKIYIKGIRFILLPLDICLVEQK